MPRFAKSLLAALFVFAAIAASIARPALADHPAVGLGSGIAGPIITIPAAVLPAGTWAAGIRIEQISFQTVSDSELVRFAEQGIEAHSTRNVTSPSLSLAYGVTRTFTASARLPYVVRRDLREGHLEGTTAEAHRHGDSRGMGDLTVAGQFLVSERAGVMIATLGGLKLPTGRTGVTDPEGERLETEHQPGSGSLDFLAGISGSARVPFGSVDASLLGTMATHGAQDATLGNVLHYDVAVSAKVVGRGEHPHAHSPGEAPHPHGHSGVVGADLILELNGESHSKQRIGGIDDPNSGGNLIYLSAGVRFGPERWSVSLSAGFPIVQDVNGIQHETEFRLLGGFGMSF